MVTIRLMTGLMMEVSASSLQCGYRQLSTGSTFNFQKIPSYFWFFSLNSWKFAFVTV